MMSGMSDIVKELQAQVHALQAENARLRDALHPLELRLLDCLRGISHGEVTVKIQDGLPLLVIETQRKIKLAGGG